MSKRTDALRRLGGPVCPVCGTVGELKVYALSDDDREWIAQRRKSDHIKEGLIPMCNRCDGEKNTHARMKEMERERQRQAEQNRMRKDAEWLVRLGSQKNYHHACADHQGDLAAAEEIAASWGIGNSLFGRRPRE